MVIDVPTQTNKQLPPPPQNDWEQPFIPPVNNAPFDDSSAISSRESLTVRTLCSKVSYITANMTEVQNQFELLLQSNRLNEHKNTQRNEQLQAFISESGAQQQESREAQRELERNQSNTDHFLAFLNQKLNLNADFIPSPSNNNKPHNNNDTNRQHPQPRHHQQKQQP